MKLTFHELSTESEILDLINFHNEESEYVVVDLETTGLDPFRDTITDIVLSGKGEHSAAIFPGSFATLLRELKKPVVAHNFKFDFNFLFRVGVDLRIPGLFADTMLLDHLLDENQEHSLDSIIKRRYNENYKEVFWEKYKNYSEATKEEQIEYACKDVIYTRKAYNDIRRDLRESLIPDSLIIHVHRLAEALYDTEITGIKLDLNYLEKMGSELTIKISQLRTDMRKLVNSSCEIIELDDYLKELDKRKTDKGKAGVKRPEFNFDSNTQLGRLVYDQLKLPVQLNKQRNRTVDDAALEKLEDYHSIVPKIREYRGHQKVYTAFIEGALSKMTGGRIYPSFNVNGTVTGRISSSNPNMQQLPKDGGVRGIYIPEPGYKFISCDYAQLEVTLAAHFSRDPNLLKIVYEGASQHDITAAGLGISRQTAKTINFALQYGAGAKKIQKILGCSEKEAEHALEKYWLTYAGLRDFIRSCHERIERGEPLISPFGRRRNFHGFKELDHWSKERIKRQGPNSLIQGTGADITNRAFYLVSEKLNNSFMLGRALFPIHDEILIMVEDAYVEEASNILKTIMVDVGKEINLTVPLSVDCSKPMSRWEKG